MKTLSPFRITKKIARIIALLSVILLISIMFTGCDNSGSSGGGGGSTVPGENPGPTVPSSTVPVVITESPAVTLPASASGTVGVEKNTILEVPNRIDGCMVPISEIFDVTLNGGNADFGTDFAIIEFEYDDDDLSDNGLMEEFAAYYFDGSKWKQADKTIVDTENNIVEVYTTHFTPFVLTAYDQNATATGVAAPPAKIEEVFPTGIGGNGNAVFSIVDENFRYYQDRDYTIRPATDEYPENKAAFEEFGFKGALGISTINGGAGLGEMQFHKYFEANSYIKFVAHMDIDVYVMYDTRGGTGREDGSQDALWLYALGFTKTDYYVQTTDGVGYYSVYKKTYLEGQTVYLHGNRMGVVEDPIETNYWAIVKPMGNTDNYAASATCGAESDITAPGAVTGLTATPLSGKVRLSWTNPADDDFAGVIVRRSTTAYPANPADGEAPTGAFNGTTEFEDTGVIEGGVYYYTVFSVDENANWTDANVSTNYTDPFNPPGDVTITNVTPLYNTVVINWNDPADFDIDYIKVSTPGHTPQEVEPGIGICNFIGLDMSTNYTFTITVYDNDGNQSAGEVVNATTTDSVTFDSATMPCDTVSVTIGGETIDLIYANNQAEINFPFSSNENSPADNLYATLTNRFFMSKTEVTNALYAEVLQWAYDNGKFGETGSLLTAVTAAYRAQQLIDLDDSYCMITYTASPAVGEPNFTADSGYDDHPVVCVTWYGAVIFCNWLTEMRDSGTANVVYTGIPAAGTDWGYDDTVADDSKTGYRLPTSAEWEYAARYIGKTSPSSGSLATEYIAQGINGGHSSLTAGYFWTPADYASGAAADYNNEAATRAVGWYSGDTDMGAGGDKLMPVAQKAANQLGLYDMSGNVNEWCFDQYYLSFMGFCRVMQGGCWAYMANGMQVGLLNYIWPDFKYEGVGFYIGFRFARTK